MSLNQACWPIAGQGRARTVGRLADSTIINGAVLTPDLTTGLYTVSALVGSGHAGTPAQTQGEADSRMAGGWFDLLLFRSTANHTSFDSNLGYDGVKWSPYKLYRRSAKGLGWAGHTWQADDGGVQLYPVDDGTAVNLLTSSFTLPWGLYLMAITTWLPSADTGGGGPGTVSGSNNDMTYMVRTTGSVTDATLTDFVWNYPGGSGDQDDLLQYGNDSGAYQLGPRFPFRQAGYSAGVAFAAGGLPQRRCCCKSNEVVRFRVNRAVWSD